MSDKNINIEEIAKRYQPECSICYEKISPNDKVTLDCNHEFHKHCIGIWAGQNKNNTCPMCRVSLQVKTYPGTIKRDTSQRGGTRRKKNKIKD